MNRKRRSKPRAVTQTTPITPTVIIQIVTATAETATTTVTIITVLTMVTTAVEIIITMIQAIHHQVLVHLTEIGLLNMKMKMGLLILMMKATLGMTKDTLGTTKIYGKALINT